MTDMLIRDVPDDVIAALDAHAGRLGLSRSEYVRRRVAQDAAAPRTSVRVLHRDKDFDVIAQITGQPVERLTA
jgi:hypothetical protein